MNKPETRAVQIRLPVELEKQVLEQYPYFTLSEIVRFALLKLKEAK